MAIRFAMSGGNFPFTQGASATGIWASSNGAYTSSAPGGRSTTYAITNASSQWFTPNLGGNFAGLIAGAAWYPSNITNDQQIMFFRDQNGNAQCSLRSNATGQLYFTLGNNNTTAIGGSYSTAALLQNTWQYIEFKAIFSNSGAGTCEVRVNGVVFLTKTAITNAVNTNGGAQLVYQLTASATPYATDFYVLDTSAGINTGYLGDITVAELFPNGPGVNSAWTPNVGPFTLTSVNTAGVYQGTITGGTGNAYVGYNFNVTGFVNGANNQTGAQCTASSATSITLGGVTINETHAGSAAFQAIVQPGINQSGSRPNNDVTYISSSTTNQISDFAHTALVLTGTIYGVVHQTYARKDDSGARVIAQVCLSSGTTEVSSNISLGNAYAYYQDILEQNPNGPTGWTLTTVNAATFGVKELT